MIERVGVDDDGLWTVTLCELAAWILNRHTLSTARGESYETALRQAMQYAGVTHIVRPRRPFKRLLRDLCEALS